MPPSNHPRPYRVPAALLDLVMIDLLELTGSTTRTADLLSISQPTVSRRYRSVARDLGLQRKQGAPVGRRFGDPPWMRWLRKGVNHHRLANGLLRVGGGCELEPLFTLVPWAHWVPLGREQHENWRWLLELELLDAVALAKLPDLTSEEAVQVAQVEVRPSRESQVVLLCRRDPMVLEICSRL